MESHLVLVYKFQESTANIVVSAVHNCSFDHELLCISAKRLVSIHPDINARYFQSHNSNTDAIKCYYEEKNTYINPVNRKSINTNNVIDWLNLFNINRAANASREGACQVRDMLSSLNKAMKKKSISKSKAIMDSIVALPDIALNNRLLKHQCY